MTEQRAQYITGDDGLTWHPIQVRLGDLDGWDGNPKTLTKTAAARLLKSTQRLGQLQTIAVSPAKPDGRRDIYDGHQRDAVWSKGYHPDIVVWALESSRPLTDKERRDVVMLTMTARGSFDWDALAGWTDLGEYFDAVDLGEWKRDVAALDNFLKSEKGEPVDAEPQIDRAEELRAKWQVETGQMWQLGDHRLICGDCTDPAVVARVMGGGKADLNFSDPPYGIGRDEGFEGFGGFGTPIARRQYSDDWDSERPSKEQFGLMLNSARNSIIWGGNFFADLLPMSTHWIVWDKNNTMPTFGDAELAWTSLKRTSVKKYEITYNGLIGKEKERFHPTQKPIKLYVECLRDYTKENQTIIDFYSGSGTTLIACENLGRKCRAIEISPAYVAVALERWATATGKTPVLLETALN